MLWESLRDGVCEGSNDTPVEELVSTQVRPFHFGHVTGVPVEVP